MSLCRASNFRSLTNATQLISMKKLPSRFTRPFVAKFLPGPDLSLQLAVAEGLDGAEPIHREHDLPSFHVDGQTVTDQRAMRSGVIPQDTQLCKALTTRDPLREIVGFGSNGNLGANYGFVAFVGGRLIHLRDELVFKRSYTCIVAWNDGHVSVEEIWFARENGNRIDVLRKNGHHTHPSGQRALQNITDQISFVTSGQPLVRRAKAVALELVAEQWYDTRHLVQPIRLQIGGAALFFPNAQLQNGLLRLALCQPVHVRLEAEADERTRLPLSSKGWLALARENPEGLAKTEAFLKQQGLLMAADSLKDSTVLTRVGETMEALLEAALKTGGYDLVDGSGPLREGEARYLNGHLEIFFRKAIYPHHIFVRWADGYCGFVVFRGKSGREGTTLPHAQEVLLNDLKVQDAVLLDNGGDARLWYRGQYLVTPSERRPEIRSLLALTAPKDHWIGEAAVAFGGDGPEEASTVVQGAQTA